MRNLRNTRTLEIGAALTGVVLLAAVAVAAGADKPAELNRAVEDIRRVEQTVRARMTQAEALRSQLRQEAELLKAEIREVQRRRNIVQFAAAVQDRRIDYNLRLLQRLAGYGEQLEGRFAEFQSVLTCFERYRERVRDEVRNVRTLKDADTAELLRQIAAALDEASGRCAEPLVRLPAPQRPLESLWTEALQMR